MKFNLLIPAVLSSLITLSYAHCIHISGNARIKSKTDLRLFSVLYYDGELVCSIDRSIRPDLMAAEWQYDCHDGHYAILGQWIGTVMYAHDNKNYKLATHAKMVEDNTAWVWDVKQGC